MPNGNVIRLSGDRHEHIDRLAGVDSSHRSPNDQIKATIFDFLNSRVEAASRDVGKYVNKFIAHAASPKSRASANADSVRLTLQHIKDAHRALCRVASFLTIYILGDAMAGFLPTPQYDHLEHIEQPLVVREGVQTLDDLWNKLHSQYEEWSQCSLEDFVTEMKNEMNIS